MGLPKLSGWETLLKINEINSYVKIIVTSGYLDPKFEYKKVSNICEFVRKPFETDVLLQTIRKVPDK